MLKPQGAGMQQYCVYYKLKKNHSSWSKFHVRASSSTEAIAITTKPFTHYPELVVLGAPLTFEKTNFEKLHGLR
jgi:hypothetical protein